MRIALIILMLTITSQTALAQNKPVFQSGLVAHGRPTYWMTDGVVGDPGSAQSSRITELGITNTGLPFAINDQLTTSSSGYHQLSIGSFALGSGLINYQAHGGASPAPLNVNVDGPMVISSKPGVVKITGLPTAPGGAIQLCISPTTGALSIAGNGVTCGGGTPPAQFVLLQGGGFLLLQGGAGKVQLQ